MDSKYTSWSVSALKIELAKRNASAKGRKIDLIDRLESYDRNNDFRGEIISIPNVEIPKWPASGFKSLNSEMAKEIPKIHDSQIDSYFKYRQVSDNLSAGDLKALEKGNLLYKSDYLLAISACICPDEKSFYFSGCTKAAMKTKLAYNFRLKIIDTGEIVNSDCECPAGKGPYGTCKHIAAAVYGLQSISSTGQLRVQASCTDELQTFHKPKHLHSGTPIKVQNLPRSGNRDSNYQVDDDPRPLKNRNRPEYGDFVRNMVINYCNESQSDISLRYLYSKAYIQTAAQDHDYFTIPFTEMWVDKANELTETEVLELERKTRGQSKNKTWLKARQWRLTASNFGTICKSTWRRNKKKLCKTLYGSLRFTTAAILHGKMYESVAISRFEEKYNLKVQQCGLFVSSKLNFMGASPDGVIDSEYIIEVKCPYSGRNDIISPCKKFSYLEWKEEKMQLKRNSNYFYQIQGQLYISNRKFCYFIIYTHTDMFVEIIQIEKDYFETCIIPKLTLFYEKKYRPFIASLL